MSVIRVLLGFAALTNALAAWAWFTAGKPELAAGFTVQSLILTWGTARHWSEL